MLTVFIVGYNAENKKTGSRVKLRRTKIQPQINEDEMKIKNEIHAA